MHSRRWHMSYRYVNLNQFMISVAKMLVMTMMMMMMMLKEIIMMQTDILVEFSCIRAKVFLGQVSLLILIIWYRRVLVHVQMTLNERLSFFLIEIVRL